MPQKPSPLHLFLGHGLALLVVCPVCYSAIFGLIYRKCGAPILPDLASISTCEVAWASNAFLLVLVPLVHLILVGPTVWIRNRVSVRIDVPLSICSQFIRDARNLSQYEQKVQGCNTSPGGFTIWGSWFGLPFCKSFKMIQTQDGGFHSVVKKLGAEDVVPGVFRFFGSGGFRTLPDADAQPIVVNVKWVAEACNLNSGDVNEDGDSVQEPPTKVRRTDTTVNVQPTKLIHYESYGWPVTFPYMPLLAVAWRVWHRRGMEVEMELIKVQVEHIFKEVQESSVDACSLVEESMFAADYPPAGTNTWGTWKYGASDYLKEAFAKALCRPYKSHHPFVGTSASVGGRRQH